MKMKKTGVRLLAGVLALLLAIALIAGSLISVRGAEADGYRLRFTGSASAGDTLYLYLDMTGVESVSALQILVTYDDKQLSLTSASTGDALSGTMAELNDTVSGQLKMAAISVSEVTPNGVVLSAEFTVDSDVVAGDEISVSAEIQESYDEDLNKNPAMGTVFTATIAAGGSAAQSDTAGIAQSETATLTESAAAASAAGDTGTADGTTSSSTAGDTAGDSAVGEGSENKWVIPAAILLVAAVAVVVLVVVFRPKEKAEEAEVLVESGESPEADSENPVEKSNKSESGKPKE